VLGCPIDFSICKHADGIGRKDLAIVDDCDKSPPTNAKASRQKGFAVTVGETSLPIDGMYNNTDTFFGLHVTTVFHPHISFLVHM